MGAQPSTALSAEDIECLSTAFSETIVNKFYKRFRRLDKDDLGAIGFDDFMAIPEFAMNPLSDRIFAVLDGDHEDAVNFPQFLRSVSVFSEHATIEDKARFIFRIYDVDGDGYISSEDLTHLLKLCVGKYLTPEQIAFIVRQTIREADTVDKDGRISFEEFEKVIGNSKTITSKLNIPFEF